MKRGGIKNGPVRPGFKPKHSLGQNFLTDTALLEELIEEKTGINTITADEPMTCVAIGTGKYIEFLDAMGE